MDELINPSAFALYPPNVWTVCGPHGLLLPEHPTYGPTALLFDDTDLAQRFADGPGGPRSVVPMPDVGQLIALLLTAATHAKVTHVGINCDPAETGRGFYFAVAHVCGVLAAG